MYKLIKTAIIFLIMMTLSGPGRTYCEEAKRDLKTMSGSVSNVDWVGSLITVSGEYEMTFVILPNTKITREAESSSLLDINTGDYVVVKYCDSPTGEYQAVWISLEKPYPPF